MNGWIAFVSRSIEKRGSRFPRFALHFRPGRAAECLPQALRDYLPRPEAGPAFRCTLREVLFSRLHRPSRTGVGDKLTSGVEGRGNAERRRRILDPAIMHSYANLFESALEVAVRVQAVFP